MAGCVDLVLEIGDHARVKPLADVRIEVGEVLDGEGDVVLEVGAIGDVVVDEEVRQPAMKHLPGRRASPAHRPSCSRD